MLTFIVVSYRYNSWYNYYIIVSTLGAEEAMAEKVETRFFDGFSGILLLFMGILNIYKRKENRGEM